MNVDSMTEAELSAAMAKLNAKRQALAASKKPSTSRDVPIVSAEPGVAKVAPVNTPSANKYSDLDGINTGRLASSKWSDEDLASIAVYRIQPVTAAKSISLGRRLVTDLMTGTVTSSTADICLVLALSLPKPASQAYEHFLFQIPPNLGQSNIFTVPEATDAPVGLSMAERRQMQAMRDKLAATDSHEEQEALRGRLRKLEQQEIGAVAVAVPVVSEVDATAYCFLAAFMMKLCGRSEESFLESVAQMRIRYPAWYEGNSTVLSEFLPTLDTIRALRVIFNRRPELLNTWIMTVACNENGPYPLTTTQQGLLNYLACQQYAYTGMHSYTLLLTIHETTGITLGTLLKQMDCPATRASVRAAYEIIRDHEITSRNPNRKTYFRYARVWNPKYFSALQSSNCTTLVYVAAKVAKMTGSQKAGGDPMGIFAIKDLDDALKTRLDAVANKMTAFIFNMMLVDQESGEAWRP